MSFIGIYVKSREFNLIKPKILECINSNTVNIMRINQRNIENIKNIKFDTIVISKQIKQTDKNIEYLKKLIINCKYLILNSDASICLEVNNEQKINIITYGLDQKATVTVSSIKDENILIGLQRELENVYGDILELQEFNVDAKKYRNIKVENILMIYAILMIYDKKKIKL